MMYACVQKQVQIHTDFVTTHYDMIHDVTGLGGLEGSQLEAVLALEEQIKQASQRVSAQPLQGPGWQNYPMTPVASSFIKGAGAYKGKLLLEYHFDPGRIWGYDVLGQGTEFFEELMLSGSKGGWVWDKILGKPSQFGMAKGKFFAYKDANGVQKFATTPGAEFVHHFGRPAEFTYNPVGYLNNSEEWYNVRAEQGKIWKESLVDPAQSRNPIEQSKLRAMQRNEAFTELQEMLRRKEAIESLGPLFETEKRRGTLEEISELLKPHLTKKDFLEILENLLNSQMTLIPVMDLVEDYKVKGYYANRGKPPKRTFIRRHTREEGTTIKDKPRLTLERVRLAHAKSIREKRKDIVPLWKKLKDLKEERERIGRKLDEAEAKGQFETIVKLDVQYNKIIEELNKIRVFQENELFDTHNDLNLQYDFSQPLNDKIRVAKGIIYGSPFVYGMKIDFINEIFNKLPKPLQDSCKQVRIFEIANDDPALGSLEGCGGFYDPPNQTITIGLRASRDINTPRSGWLFSLRFLKEATVHEAAHALEYDKLGSYEKQLNNSLYEQNRNILKAKGWYAGKNKAEFFAEGYTNLYTNNNYWFKDLTATTKSFFRDIMKRYDFILGLILTPLNEKINGIKFSYKLNDKWIFGFYRIPEEISFEEAEIMVSEGKAQFENVDKYIDFGEEND